MILRVESLRLLASRAYLVVLDGGLILVDAGMPGEEMRIIRQVKDHGYDDISLIFITHAHIDHYGSAAAIREITQAPIAIHEADAEAMALGETRLGTARGIGRAVSSMLPAIQRIWKTPPTQADILLKDADDLSNLGLWGKLLHLPGHTHGSSCLVVNKSAFVGDLITASRGRPRLQRYYAQDWSLVDESFSRLLAIQPERVYPGHGGKQIEASGLIRL